MSDQDLAELVRNANRFGEHLLLFEFFAACNYADYEIGWRIPDVVFKHYDEVVNTIKEIVQLKGMPKSVGERFRRCLKGFLNEYLRQFGSQEHREKAHERDHGIDAEWCTEFMLRGSPLESTEFARLLKYREELVCELPEIAKASYYMGRDAGSPYYGFYTHELDTRTSVQERLRQNGEILKKHFADPLPFPPWNGRGLLKDRLRPTSSPWVIRSRKGRDILACSSSLVRSTAPASKKGLNSRDF